MEEKIRWRKKARQRLQEIYEFLLEHWGERVADNFLSTVDRDLELLLLFPDLGITSIDEPRVRQFLITKHNWLIYTVKGDTIIVVNIRDTRRR